MTTKLPTGVDESSLRDYYYSCNELSARCPVQATTLGYMPNAGVNYFLTIGFGLAGITTLTIGVWKKTWSFMAFVTAGCMLEMAGYASRIPLASNPWNKHAFETQICAIVLAPTLLCISIYLTLKHFCLALNPSLSRVRPHLYPFIFVPLDVSCLLVQAIGGALAASAGYDNFAMLNHGNRAIIAGITLQVVVLLLFGTVAMDYYLRVRRWVRRGEGVDEDVRALWGGRGFGMFLYAVTGAYSAVLVRCVYRIAEMAGGWANPIMQDEASFIALEGVMILIACVLLACFPPGIFFPQMAARMSARGRKGGEMAEESGKQEKGVTEAVPDSNRSE